MDITKLSITELKAMKLDIYEANQVALNNMNIINAEIKRREEAKNSEVGTPPQGTGKEPDIKKK